MRKIYSILIICFVIAMTAMAAFADYGMDEEEGGATAVLVVILFLVSVHPKL